jgi:two-component system NarL family sensor kinase
MDENEIFIAIVLTILLYIASTVVIILFVVRNQKRKRQHADTILENERKFQTELVRAEMEVQEHIRKNIATDLHDNIGQLLSLTSVTVGSINLKQADKAAIKIQDIQSLLSRSIGELRQLSRIIHGEQLLRDGLVEAIQQEIVWLEKSNAYEITFLHDLSTINSVNPQKDLFIFRLFQEAFNNTLKHARADKLEVVIGHGAGTLQLSVSDNGIGFDSTSSSGGLGIENMRKRVGLLAGRLDVRSEINKGTVIQFFIPYE